MDNMNIFRPGKELCLIKNALHVPHVVLN